MAKNNSKNLPDPLATVTKKLINWKEELVVWSIVISTAISIVQLTITLIILSKGK